METRLIVLVVFVFGVCHFTEGQLQPVTPLTTTINSTTCGTSKLCLTSPGNCNPAGNASCFFSSTQLSNGVLTVEISGNTSGYVALGLTPTTTLTQQLFQGPVVFVCGNNNSNVFFETATQNSSGLTPANVNSLNITNIQGSVTTNQSRTQCTFNVTLNSTLLNSILLNSTLLNSSLTSTLNSTFNYTLNSTLLDSSLSNTLSSILLNSTLSSNVLNIILLNTSLFNSTLINTNLVTSNTGPILLNSILLNSILLNSTLLNSILLNSILLNSTLLNSILLNSTFLNYTQLNFNINSTILNSTISSILVNSTFINSTLLSPTLLNSTFLSSFLLNSILLNTNLINSTLINPILLNGAGQLLFNATILTGTTNGTSLGSPVAVFNSNGPLDLANPKAFLPNLATLNINRSGCGSTKLCVSTASNCDPSGSTSCFFGSFQLKNQNLYYELSGTTVGYVALGLTKQNSTVVFVCGNNNTGFNNNFFFQTATQNNTVLSPATVSTVYSNQGILIASQPLVQCIFNTSTSFNISSKSADTSYEVLVLSGTTNGTALGTPTVLYDSVNPLDLTNPAALNPTTNTSTVNMASRCTNVLTVLFSALVLRLL